MRSSDFRSVVEPIRRAKGGRADTPQSQPDHHPHVVVVMPPHPPAPQPHPVHQMIGALALAALVDRIRLAAAQHLMARHRREPGHGR